MNRSKRNSNKRRSGKRGEGNIPGVVYDNKKRVVTFKAGEGPSVEYKYLDYSNPGVNVYDAGVVSLMNACIQGLDSISDRIGRKITMKSIQVRGIIANTVAQLNAANFVGGTDCMKVAIVLDKQTNGAAPTLADIFNTSGAVNAPFSNTTVSNVDRFTVLYETLLTICATGSNIAKFDVTIPCNIDTRFNAGNAGNSADIVSGGLYIVFVDQNNTATNQTTASWISRVILTDS